MNSSSSFIGPQWTTPQALAWLTLHDAETVEALDLERASLTLASIKIIHLCKSSDIQQFASLRGDGHLHGQSTGQAITALLSQLQRSIQEGGVKAIGRRAGSSMMERLDHVALAEMRFADHEDVAALVPSGYPNNSDTIWVDLRFLRSEIKALAFDAIPTDRSTASRIIWMKREIARLLGDGPLGKEVVRDRIPRADYSKTIFETAWAETDSSLKFRRGEHSRKPSG